MGIKLSTPVERIVKNSKENYGQELKYTAVTVIDNAKEDSPAVAELRAAFVNIADKYEEAFGPTVANFAKVMRSDGPIIKALELSLQSSQAVLDAGFKPVVAATAHKADSGI